MKVIFEFLTEPLGLPIAWYYEWLILVIIGAIAFGIAYGIVGALYDGDFIDGRGVGSFIHWLIRLLVFAALWAISYGVIAFVKWLSDNWVIIVSIVGGLIVAAIIACSIVLSIKYKRKRGMGVTKTDFMRGMQCPKMLWLDKHKKEERIIPPEIQDLLHKGNEFGDRAMGMFGEFVEITTYTEDGRLDYKTMLAKTTECLNNGTPVICEAAFSYYNNYCAVDILRRVEGGYELYEVKNSKEVSETFEKDLAFQRYILKKCGVKIIKAAVVTRGEDENNPYIINDCTSIAAQYERLINDNIWRLGKIKKQAEEIQQEPGEQCSKPYQCWYWGYCHKTKEIQVK